MIFQFYYLIQANVYSPALGNSVSHHIFKKKLISNLPTIKKATFKDQRHLTVTGYHY